MGNGGIALLLHNLGTRKGWGGWPMQHSSCLVPRKETWYSLYRRLDGPWGRSGQVWKISPSPDFEPQTVQHVASYCNIRHPYSHTEILK